MKTVWSLVRKSGEVTLTQSEKELAVTMNTDAWAHVYLESDVENCVGNKVYRFRVDTDGADTDFRMLIQFFKRESLPSYRKGHVLEPEYGYRLYIKSGDELCVPEGMDCFNISVVASTDKNTVIRLGEVVCEFVRDYKPNCVCMCAISDKAVKDDPHTSEISLTESYCREIDRVVQKEKPDIITLTEHFHNLNLKNQEIDDKFIAMDSPVIKMISDKARQHGVYICGSFHIKENGCRYNRALLFDRKGEIIAKYDKVHLTIMEYEMGIRPGDDISYVDTELGRIGFIICWDMYFPEIIRKYYKNGCDILLCPTRGNARYQNNAAAFTGSMYIVAASFDAMNRIYEPNGDVIAEMNDECYAAATVDVTKTAWRPRLSVGFYYGAGKNVFKSEMRPETY